MRCSMQGYGTLLLAGALAASFAGLAVIATMVPAFADDQPIVGIVDQARLVKIPVGTATLIIGNPTIADVTMLNANNLMVLTPKAFGQTNFIALDVNGNPLAQSTIEVVNSSDAVIVQRGMERESFSCTPNCQPIERLGDDQTFASGVASQSLAHSQRLAGATTSAPRGLPSPR